MRRSIVKHLIICASVVLCAHLVQAKSIKWQATTFEYDETLGNKALRLIGNVVFKHNGTIMKCDSAYLFKETNTLRGFGNVHITKGKTLNIHGEELFYDGKTKLMDVMRNVILKDGSITLYTDFLQYHTKKDIGKYTNHGRVLDGETELVSRYGYYNKKKQYLNFKDSVIITSPSYVIRCDTLEYDLEKDITYFLGPTTIIDSSTFIYCENGWNNSITETALFTKNAYLEIDGQKIEGDSLLFNKKQDMGYAYFNVTITDTANDMIIVGNYAKFSNNGSNVVVSDKSVLIQIYIEDTMYTYGDTLKLGYDSITENREFFAYHHVKIFKNDMQGKCDSMVYSESDSTIRMYTQPVLWFDDYQLTAEHITIETFDNEIKYFYLDKKAFIASEYDSTSYNQIKGDTIKGYFKENELEKIHVKGSSNTIFYVSEDRIEEEEIKKELIGINQFTSADMWIYMFDNEIERIHCFPEPVATMFPLKDFKNEKQFLPNFNWRGKERPRNKSDIFQ
ncbi:MAG: hypothetical protein HRT71_16345 [Flavobacteriales bacterium]|nr:hypothetical protein [Flavobacteriales bacterium]